jgi:hypothetical protein
MEVSQVVALRGPGRLTLDPPAGPVVAWLTNDVSVCRDLAVVWLKRGASASGVLELGMPATVFTRVPAGGGPLMATVMIGVDPHKASHTAVAISAAEGAAGRAEGSCLRCPGGAAAGLGRGLADADLGG